MWVRSLGREDPLEEEMATQSNVLASEIPWTEEPRAQGGHKELDTTECISMHPFQCSSTDAQKLNLL